MTAQHPDSLRAVLDSVFAAPAYRWVRRPEPLSGLRQALQSIEAWFRALEHNQPVLYQVVLYLLVVTMLALVLHTAWTFLKGIRTTERATDATALASIGRDASWFRREADRLAATGRYAEAVQADFLALVLALDAGRALRFHPSKTPGEYARESQLPPGAREDFRDLVGRLYSYAFARSPCGAAEFAEWRSRAAPERYAPAN